MHFFRQHCTSMVSMASWEGGYQVAVGDTPKLMCWEVIKKTQKRIFIKPLSGAKMEFKKRSFLGGKRAPILFSAPGAFSYRYATACRDGILAMGI